MLIPVLLFVLMDFMGQQPQEHAEPVIQTVKHALLLLTQIVFNVLMENSSIKVLV